VTIFKGLQTGSSKNVLIRKGLVITQFVVSIVLITCTVVIYKQIEHVKNRQLGYDKNNLIYVSQTGKINERLEVIEQELLSTGFVSHVASTNQRIIDLGNNSGGFEWEGKDPSKDVLITTEYVSPGYLNTAGIKLIAGRDFYKNAASDSDHVIINETFAEIIGKKDPVGAVLTYGDKKYTVTGLISGFVFNDMYKKPDPFIIFCRPHSTSYMFIRIKNEVAAEDALSKIEAVLKKVNPGYPFEYKFLDEDFNNKFRSELLVGRLSRLFAILTIIISCIGLFGLAAYTAERRTKEIGIRKVLGATVSNIIGLLSWDFVKLVLISIAISVPLAWYFMNKWLQDYSYRVDMKWWMFAVAALLALAVALFTVSFQAVRAAIANPSKSLRTE
jgi:ABC-type antimicrobial peptide transport system permease subunit